MWNKNKLLVQTLKHVVNELEDENNDLKLKLEEQDRNNLILLENSMKLRAKIKDLENNLELVTNNLSAQKRKQLGL